MIDARGLSCPEPVVLTKKALYTDESSYEILVDTRVAMENVTKYAKSCGYNVNISEDNGEFKLNLEKK